MPGYKAPNEYEPLKDVVVVATICVPEGRINETVAPEMPRPAEFLIVPEIVPSAKEKLGEIIHKNTKEAAIFNKPCIVLPLNSFI